MPSLEPPLYDSPHLAPRNALCNHGLSFCSPLRLAQLQKVTQLHSCFVQLRLAIADGAAHHLRNLVVLVAFDIVQHEDNAVSRWQTLDRALQIDPIDGSDQHIIAGADVPPGTVSYTHLTLPTNREV